MNSILLNYLGGRKSLTASAGGVELELCVLSAAELLRARREASELCQDETELALWQNACLIARCAQKDGRRVFASGSEVMESLSAEQIGAFMDGYLELCENSSPSARMDGEKVRQLKDALGASAYERLKWRVLKAFGALVTEQRAKDMTDGDYLYCILNQWLDDEEELDRLCPTCRSEAEQGRCPGCGAAYTPAVRAENPAFDMERYNILARGGTLNGQA